MITLRIDKIQTNTQIKTRKKKNWTLREILAFINNNQQNGIFI